MEDILTLVVLLLVAALIVLIVIPIILLVKISAIRSGFDYMNKRIELIEIRLNTILNKSVTKEDLKEIFDIREDLRAEPSVTVASDKIETVEQVIADKKPVVPDIQPETIVPEEKKKEEPIIEKAGPVIEEKQPAKETEVIPVKNTPEEPVIRKHVDVYAPQSIRPASIRSEKKSDPILSEPTGPVQKEIRPKTPDDIREKSFFEKITGDNWLSKVGIVTLVLGIGFFVKYAIDQNWINEIGRVAIGLLTGGIIIAIAWKLKSRYHVFSSILTGGGISVFYITVTLAFREYELFGQTPAFILLIAVTVFSVILSLLYDRKELAIFSLLGGFASPLMVSTGAGNYIVLFSYILILNTGMLLVSLRKKWKAVGIIGYVLTLLFFWSWLLSSFETQFNGALLFCLLFFVQFYLLALIDHFKSEKKMSGYQAILILTNNVSFFAACLYILNDYPYDVKGIVTIAVAVVNAVVLIVLFRKSTIDRNLIYLVIAIVLSFVSLAIPIQLNGHIITLFWAAEGVLLLWLYQRSEIKIFRIGFLLISILTVISYIMDVSGNYGHSAPLPIIANRIFVTGAVVTISFFVSSYLLKKEDRKDAVTPNIFKCAAILFAFTVPFLELNHQLSFYSDIDYISSFRHLTSAAYAMSYIAGLTVIYRNRLASNTFIYGLSFTSIFLYAVFYSLLSSELRFDIYYANTYPSYYFLMHLVGFAAVIIISCLLIKNVRTLPVNFSLFGWAMSILSVIILSVETDNIVIMLFGNKENYDLVLYDVHTFGYPILWGIIAMTLMIWGLKQKEVLLRKISLIFFGIIILKFYAYDVWHMSQAGRIVSFVLLGVILLSVSFLQQKIKTLVKDDEPDKI